MQRKKLKESDFRIYEHRIVLSQIKEEFVCFLSQFFVVCRFLLFKRLKIIT